MTAVSPESVLVRSERLSWRVIDGEALILYPEAGTLHRLNPTGTELWERLDGTATVAEIAAALCGDYEVAEAEAVADLRALGDDLVAAGLVSVEN